MTTRTARHLATITAVFLVATACAPLDRGVGSQVPSVVLTLANGNDSHEGLQPFADAVAKASGGTLTIEFKDRIHKGEPSYESNVIDDVVKGVYDLGWVAPRPWHARGVTSFDALIAPFLVDSYALQAEVLKSDLEPEMLAGLDGTGLVGLGILPGPLRHVATADGKFGGPTDLSGDVVAIQDSFVAAETFRALGATTSNLPAGGQLGAATAAEQQLGSITGNRYHQTLAHVTVDAALWPRPVIFFANKVRFDALAESQRTALRAAAQGLLASTLADLDREDADAIAELCADGAELQTVGSGAMPALRAAVQPVFDELAKDAGTAAAIKRISELKASVGASATVTTCPDPGPLPTSVAGGGFPDGTYEQRVSCEEFQAFWESHQTPPEFRGPCPPAGEVAIGAFTLKDGEWTESYGEEWTYSFYGDHVKLGGFTLRWTYDGTQVTFSEIQGGRPDDAVAWTIKPFVRVAVPEPSPVAGLPDGRYIADVTTEEMQAFWTAHDVPIDMRQPCPCTSGFTLRNGTWTGSDGSEWHYSFFGDQLTIGDREGDFTMRWAYDESLGQATFTDIKAGLPEQMAFGVKPFTRTDLD